MVKSTEMKNKLGSVLVLLALIGDSIASYSQCVTSEGNVHAFTYNGTNYEIVLENLTWTAAAACAVERGGYLAEINTQEENDTIFYYVNTTPILPSNTVAPDGGGASYLWIGGNDIGTEGEWIWDGDNTGASVQFWQGNASGNPVGGLYTNWGNEPDNFNNQDGLGYAITNWPLGVAEQWNDVDDGNFLYYVIEYPASGAELNENHHKSKFKAFPNPSTNEIKVQLNDAFLEHKEPKLKLYNNLGKCISEIAVNSKEININVSDLPAGQYFIKMMNANETIETIVVTIN